MIRVRDLTVRYPDAPPILAGLSVHIAPGEMTGLLGPNGSGKTTFLRAVSGSLAPSEGEVLMGGDAVSSLSHKERARRMAFVPQRPESVPDFTVFDMVCMGRYARRKFLEDYTPEDAAVVRQALAETDAAQFADRPAATLSGGELQRVFVARAFAQETAVLLLDEPATGLDPAQATAIFDQVRQRNEQKNATVLMAIHDLNLAALYCDRLIFLKNGTVAADGPTREIFTRETLERVYDAPFLLLEHPIAGLPQALALPGRGKHRQEMRPQEKPHG